MNNEPEPISITLLGKAADVLTYSYYILFLICITDLLGGEKLVGSISSFFGGQRYYESTDLYATTIVFLGIGTLVDFIHDGILHRTGRA